MTTTQRKLIEGLMCGINGVSFNFRTRFVRLYLPEGHCTDMRGAIAFVTHHFPDASSIETISGDKPDAFYTRDWSEWKLIGRSV